MPTIEDLTAANADLQKKLETLAKEREGKVLFTQDELNQQFAERGKQGARAREQELLRSLGFEKPEDAQAALAEFKKLRDGQKTDLERAQADLAEFQKKLDALAAERDAVSKERDEARKQIKDGQLRAAVVAEASKQNIRDEALDDVWLVIDKSKIAEKDGKFEGIEPLVKEIAKTKPHWLKTTKSSVIGTPRSGGRPNGESQAQSDDEKERAKVARQYQNQF